jgi:negative regulator of sigma E activity
MTDRINDQISAFIDNELPDDESALLVRRFERDSEARARAMRYTLIGSALRGELLEPHPSVLRQRVAAALSGVTPGVARGRQRQSLRFGAPLARIGIAAAVAVVAIGGLRWFNDVEPATGAVVGPLVTRETPDSYIVPEPTDQSRTIPVVPVTLTTYLMHHSEYASQLTRNSVSSNVVGAAMEEVELVPTATFTKPVPDELEPVAVQPTEPQ